MPVTSVLREIVPVSNSDPNFGVARHLAIRPIEADYLLTRLPSGVNGAQNNLRLSAGVVLRIR
jgi:hypothetical protein